MNVEELIRKLEVHKKNLASILKIVQKDFESSDKEWVCMKLRAVIGFLNYLIEDLKKVGDG